jgi:hypothetical protein
MRLFSSSGRAASLVGWLAFCVASARASAAYADDNPTPPPTANAPPGASAPTPAPAVPAPAMPKSDHPTPLQVDYAQYGLAIGGDFDLESGGICPTNEVTPCIIGSGGGLTLRGAYKPSGPWYFGGAYQFSKLDSNNLFRLGVFQILRFEARYYIDFGSIIKPYLEWGGGPCIYGNLWGADTGGAVLRAGGGVEFEVTRFALVGLGLVYQPALLVGYTDTTHQARDTGITQFLHFEVVVELRSEVSRE